MINVPNVPLDVVAEQVGRVLTSFWPLIALVAGIAVGLWIFKRALSVFASRR